MSRSIDEQVAILMQGTAYGDDKLKQNMSQALQQRLDQVNEKGRPLRVYCGFDPRTSDLHLGHTVPLNKLRQFQDLGHDVTFLIGSYTSLIGDPSDKDKLRQQLSLEDTLSNAETYAEQSFKVLDRQKTKVRFNHSWLGELSFKEVIEIASNFTVQQFLSRENFRKRYDNNEAIYLHEFFYALMQGYDAVAMETDVQVGCSDQLFNIVTAGRKLQKAHKQSPQVAVILDILPGTDGYIRMSKSLGNHIPIHSPPTKMFGMVMKLPDHVMLQFFKLVTRYEPAEIENIDLGLRSGSKKPMEVKMELAREIVSIFHGEEGVVTGEAHFKRVYQDRDLPAEMPEKQLTEPARLVDIIFEAGLSSSKSQIRRLIKQRGIRLDGRKVENDRLVLESGTEAVIQVGKHQFLRLIP